MIGVGMVAGPPDAAPPPSYSHFRPRGRSRQFSTAADLTAPSQGFSIDLDKPDKVFTAGDLVTGIVTLRCQNQEPVGRVAITMTGDSEVVSYQKRGTAASKTSLFTLLQVLHEGQEILEPDTHQWAFQFTFPARAQDLAEHKQWPQSPLFAAAAEQPLPPSFTLDHVTVLTGFEARVIYRLTATFLRPNTKETAYQRDMVLNCSKQASPTTLPMDFRKESKVCTVQSLLLLPDRQGRALSFRERSRSIVGATLPSAYFTVEVGVPQHLHVGEKMSIPITIRHDMAHTTCKEIPEVELERFSLKIFMETTVRSPKGIFSGGMQTHERVVYERIKINVSTFRPAPEITKTIATEALITSQSSFKTLNVSRTYRSEVEIAVKCADKSFVVQTGGLLKLDPEPLDVVPETVRLRDEDEDELPTYRANPAALDPQSTLLFDEPPPPAPTGYVGRVGRRPTFNAYTFTGAATPITGAGWR